MPGTALKLGGFTMRSTMTCTQHPQDLRQMRVNKRPLSRPRMVHGLQYVIGA